MASARSLETSGAAAQMGGEGSRPGAGVGRASVAASPAGVREPDRSSSPAATGSPTASGREAVPAAPVRPEGRRPGRGTQVRCAPRGKDRFHLRPLGLNREGGLRPGFHQRLANRLAEAVVNHRLPAKTHFGLGGVDIDVHFFKGHLDKDQGHRKGSVRKDAPVGFAQSVHENPVPHHAAVDEEIEGPAVRLLHLRLGYEGVNPDFFLPSANPGVIRSGRGAATPPPARPVARAGPLRTPGTAGRARVLRPESRTSLTPSR